MRVASADVHSEEFPKPPVRLRTLLILGALLWAVWSLYPRAVAAWKLHSAATTVADYALCMVGPTGPSLLRDNPSEFRKLVRRRLVSQEPTSRPFAECAEAAGELSGDPNVESAHRAQAWNFVEYGGVAADRLERKDARALSLEALRVTTSPLARLSKQSWPFVRQGYMRLVKPSLSAHEAIHPSALPRAAVGHGLPVWRTRYRSVHKTRDAYLLAVGTGSQLSLYKSRDSGLTWRPASVQDPAVKGFAERCVGNEERWYTFAMSRDRSHSVVLSHVAGAPASSSRLAESGMNVFATACDEHMLVAAAKPKRSREVTLYRCQFGRDCAELRGPEFAGTGQKPRFPLDIARVDGVTILAATMHGVVRVSSSRDDGRTWTPFSVAFDAAAHENLRVHVKVPGQLLVLGERVLLYGGAPGPSQTYPVLASDDYGASWRTP